MRILFVGDLNGYARSFQRYLAFKDLGHDVFGVSYLPVGYYPGFTDGRVSGEISLLSKISNKLGYPADTLKVNEKIIDFVRKLSFDIIWLEKFLALKPETLIRIKKMQPRARIVFYSGDDMIARYNQSKYFLSGITLYDCIVTTKSYNLNKNELPALGAKKVIFVDQGYDPGFHRPVDLNPEDKKVYGADTGFIGTYEQDRADKIVFLAKHGIKVRVWGNGWGKLVGYHPDLKIENSPIFGLSYIKSIAATKINLCFLRKSSRDLQTDRTMEIPACAGFMLAERTIEHLRLFKEGSEVAFFDIGSTGELLEKTRYYLMHDEERIEMAKAARQRCLTSSYTHHDRLKFILSSI
jgi:hypothetical protein